MGPFEFSGLDFGILTKLFQKLFDGLYLQNCMPQADMSNVKILGAVSIINKSQCQCQFQCQSFSNRNVNTNVNFDSWELTCLNVNVNYLFDLNVNVNSIDFGQWLLTFYTRVNSFERPLNVNVNCFLDLNVNFNVNDGKW